MPWHLQRIQSPKECGHCFPPGSFALIVKLYLLQLMMKSFDLYYEKTPNYGKCVQCNYIS